VREKPIGWSSTILLLCLSLYVQVGRCQETAKGQVPIIRVSSNLVSVPVSVTDPSDRAVETLKAEDFTIEEDGKLQSIAGMAQPGETPIELSLLFDISGSVLSHFEFIQQAASRFLKGVLRPIDAVSVYTIGSRPQQIQDRSMGTSAALESLFRIRPTKEETAFFDSVVAAAHFLRQTAAPDTRRVVIVLSDGEDNSSDLYRLEDALRELQRSDCIFYSINPSGPSIRLNKISLRGQAGMQAIASHTGGAAFLTEKLEDLDPIFTRVAAELRAQYVLAYYPTNQEMDGSFRRISVRVPSHPELRIRARQGYYARKA
jgi:Ca-activated chloride channel family protein